MNTKFDELTKSMAQSVTRRAALKKFGVGLAGMALAAFGLADKAGARVRPQGYCQIHRGFDPGQPVAYTGRCVDPVSCVGAPSADCPVGPVGNNIKAYFGCGGIFSPLDLKKGCSFTT
jgi:hypothetical protein